MTKRRPPLSIDAALSRIAGQLEGSWGQMGKTCGRTARTVRNWGDPDKNEQIPMDCAIALDIAYQDAGGDGAPIFEAYATKLELAEVAHFASEIELLRLAARSARECGEANEALVLAAHPAAGPAERQAALNEVSEAFETLKRALPLLERPPP